MAPDQNKIRKTIRKLDKSLDSQSHWRSPEKVHDLRTRSRRLEAVIRALMLDQEQPGNSLLKAITRIFKKAGKVRDMDVLTGFASGLPVDGKDPDHGACLAQLLQHLQEKRQKSALKLHARIAKHSKQVSHLLKQCSSRLRDKSDPADAQRLQSNATAFALQLCGELTAWPRLTVANMHPFRLKVKELRYTLQMAEGNDSPFVTTLKETTDAIGEWHDWSQLLEIATEVLKRHPKCSVLNAIRSAASAKRYHALHVANTMRKKFLDSDAHKSHELQTTLSKPSLAAIATLANAPSSGTRKN
jgi:CHAD domain-containing protein